MNGMDKIAIFTMYEELAEKVAKLVLSSVLQHDPENYLSCRRSKDSFEMHTHDHIIAWYKPIDSACGIRFNKVYIDMSIPLELVQTVILPMLRGFRSDVHFFYDKELYERVGADVFGI